MFPKVAASITTNPIDAFCFERLAQDDLSFSEPADPRSLIRRASIVLTGLAPTPEETTAFRTAPAKEIPRQAYTALVDRLLDFATLRRTLGTALAGRDSLGRNQWPESNLYRKNAWIYRDYVVRAFNEDKPYDQFVCEQIAGDSVGQGEATGFLVAGPHVPAATVGQEPAARRQARADRMDEIMQTVGASVMGVTIGCARCHNHKFDPISITRLLLDVGVFQDVEFGSRFPELAEDHPRRVRGKELYAKIAEQRRQTASKWGRGKRTGAASEKCTFTDHNTVGSNLASIGERRPMDELEIFGTKYGYKNLAWRPQARKPDSPEEMAVLRQGTVQDQRRRVRHDAWAGKSPKDSDEKPWVQFTFTEPREINRIRLSTNREDFLRNGLSGRTEHRTLSVAYRIEVPGSRRQVDSRLRRRRSFNN